MRIIVFGILFYSSFVEGCTRKKCEDAMAYSSIAGDAVTGVSSLFCGPQSLGIGCIGVGIGLLISISAKVGEDKQICGRAEKDKALMKQLKTLNDFMIKNQEEFKKFSKDMEADYDKLVKLNKKEINELEKANFKINNIVGNLDEINDTIVDISR